MLFPQRRSQDCTAKKKRASALCGYPSRAQNGLVRLVGLEPTTGKTPADFKPAAYANFATAAPGGYAARTG